MANDMDTTEQTRADEVRAFIARTPLAQEMGLRCEVMGDEMTMIMPYQEKLIGNFMIKAIHGGAIAAFLEALRLKPDYAGARFNLAAVYFNQRQFPAAEAELRLAVNAEPGNPETCLKLALCLQLQNDPEGARRERGRSAGSARHRTTVRTPRWHWATAPSSTSAPSCRRLGKW